MVYQAATSDVREEARNVLPIDWPDAEIQEEQAAAYDFLSAKIGPYDANTPKIDAIKKLEIILAAYFVMRPFSTQKADEKYKQFTDLLATLQSALGAAGDISTNYSTTSYQSYGAIKSENRETETTPYSSIRPITTYGVGVGGIGEPWQKPFYFYDMVKTPRC